MPFKVDDDERQILSYLLGELSAEEQLRLEERFLRDAEYREVIRAVEDDLIDDYVRGELSARERAQFEKYFSASLERRRKVEFARALAQTLGPGAGPAPAATTATPPRSDSWWEGLTNFLRAPHPAFTAALATAAVLLAIGGVWLLTETTRLRAQLDQLRAEHGPRRQQITDLQQEVAAERVRREELTAQLQREQQQQHAAREKPATEELAGRRGRPERMRAHANTRSPSSQLPAIASFVLMPGLARGSGDDAARLVLPKGTERMRLQLALEEGDDYPHYRAELRTARGELLWSRDMLRARPNAAGRSVVLILPTGLLTSGRYELTLKGLIGRDQLDEIGYYYFSILKR